MREVLLFLLVFFAIAENPISHVWSKSTLRPPPSGQHNIEVILVPGTKIDLVQKWLTSGGAEYIINPTQNSILVTITVALLEKLLSVEMYYFESGNETVVRTLDLIVVPDDIQPYVRAILGVNDFPLDRHIRRLTPKSGLRLLSVDSSEIQEPNVGDEAKSYKLFILIVGLLLPALLLLRSKTFTSNKTGDSTVSNGSHNLQDTEQQTCESEQSSTSNVDHPVTSSNGNKDGLLSAIRTTKKLRKEKRDSRKEEQERQRKEQLRIIQQEVCMRERQRSNKEQSKKECLKRQSSTATIPKDNETSSCSSTPNSKPIKKQKQPKSKSPEQRANKYHDEIKSVELNPLESNDPVNSDEEKLPLESSWSISIVQYGFPPQLVGTFDTVQDFWRCWNQIPLDRLPINCELTLLPTSETEFIDLCSSCSCGKWTASDLPVETRSSLWLQAVLLLIGEQINVETETKVKGMILRTCGQGDDVSILVQDYNTSYSAILEMQSHLFPGDIGLCFLYEPSEEERGAYEYFYTNTAEEWITWNNEFTSNDVGYNDYDYWSYNYYGWYPHEIPAHNSEESYIYASEFENTCS